MMRLFSWAERLAPDAQEGGGTPAGVVAAEGEQEVVQEGGFGPSDDDLDVVLVDRMEEKPAKTPKTEPPVDPEAKARLDALEARPDASKALLEGLGAIADRIGKVQGPANVPQQQMGESDEDFWKRIEEEAYRPGQMGKALQEATRRTMAPLVVGYQQEIIETKRQLLALDPELGPFYKRFKSEVEERVQATPRSQWDGDIYRRRLQEVMAEKGPQLREEALASKVDELVAAKLKELGVDPSKPQAPARPAMQALGGGSAGVKEAPARRQLVVTEADLEDMMRRSVITSREAMKRESPEHQNLLQYMEWKGKGRGK